METLKPEVIFPTRSHFHCVDTLYLYLYLNIQEGCYIATDAANVQPGRCYQIDSAHGVGLLIVAKAGAGKKAVVVVDGSSLENAWLLCMMMPSNMHYCNMLIHGIQHM